MITYVNPNKWDTTFFELCDIIANKLSEDTSRKVGALIVNENNVFISGVNGIPRGIKNVPERNSREGNEKYFWFEHAERNALYNALHSGFDIKECRMYVNLFPCADCMRGIIQSGIKKLYVKEIPEYDEKYPLISTSQERSLEMITESPDVTLFVLNSEI